ncbi:MAG: hypothetical protein AAB885_02245 [Patescibacteria group bacterium]
MLRNIDERLINFFKKISAPSARVGLFVIFVWFGFLKVVGVSPANELVRMLFERTIPVISFHSFIVFFGLLECLIGFLFLIKGMERVVIPLLFAHMVTTILPLFFLPQVTWSAFLVPTLEGQYIIKNLVIIAAAINIAAHLYPMKKVPS